MSFLSGFITIAGPPNVGKSTLMNYILGEKISIVSSKPQTTRNRIIGIYHRNDCQMVFMDTPGIHKTITPLHKSMVESARMSFQEVDIILFMIELYHPDVPDISSILYRMRDVKKPCILLINKIDTGPKEQALPVIEKFRQYHDFHAIIPVSALMGDGVDILLKEIKSLLKPGPRFFPQEMTTDQSEMFLVSEIIREKIYKLLWKELPYSSAVTVDKMEEIPKKNLLSIAARIYVETDSQKRILIGKNGRMIKAIGSSARLELEKRLGVRIYLDILARVEKNWSTDTKALRRLGY
ncbi:MAG: GTPase Era [Deltaproteobacteria bacterium]|nr:GTPase Era [Deltaproteobacteria bacterium]